MIIDVLRLCHLIIMLLAYAEMTIVFIYAIRVLLKFSNISTIPYLIASMFIKKKYLEFLHSPVFFVFTYRRLVYFCKFSDPWTDTKFIYTKIFI